MGYLPSSQKVENNIRKYSGKSVFHPFEMSGESAHSFLVSLKSFGLTG